MMPRRKKETLLKDKNGHRRGGGSTQWTFICLYIDKTEVLLILNSEFIHAVNSFSEVPHFISKTYCIYIKVTVSKTEGDFKYLKMNTNKPLASRTKISLPWKQQTGEKGQSLSSRQPSVNGSVNLPWQSYLLHQCWKFTSTKTLLQIKLSRSLRSSTGQAVCSSFHHPSENRHPNEFLLITLLHYSLWLSCTNYLQPQWLTTVIAGLKWNFIA